MTTIAIKERARDARHAIAKLILEDGSEYGGGLDYKIDKLLCAAFEAQAAELERAQREREALIDARLENILQQAGKLVAQQEATGGMRRLVETVKAEQAQAQRAALEARIRHMVLVAWNRTLNASGGVGYGEGSADAMKAALLAAYAAEPPAWAKTDEVIELPAPAVRQ